MGSLRATSFTVCWSTAPELHSETKIYNSVTVSGACLTEMVLSYDFLPSERNLCSVMAYLHCRTRIDICPKNGYSSDWDLDLDWNLIPSLINGNGFYTVRCNHWLWSLNLSRYCNGTFLSFSF